MAPTSKYRDHIVLFLGFPLFLLLRCYFLIKIHHTKSKPWKEGFEVRAIVMIEIYKRVVGELIMISLSFRSSLPE